MYSYHTNCTNNTYYTYSTTNTLNNAENSNLGTLLTDFFDKKSILESSISAEFGDELLMSALIPTQQVITGFIHSHVFSMTFITIRGKIPLKPRLLTIYLSHYDGNRTYYIRKSSIKYPPLK